MAWPQPRAVLLVGRRRPSATRNSSGAGIGAEVKNHMSEGAVTMITRKEVA